MARYARAWDYAPLVHNRCLFMLLSCYSVTLNQSIVLPRSPFLSREPLT